MTPQMPSTKPTDPKVARDADWYRRVYLNSAHWRTTRLEAIERAHHRCEKCRNVPDVFHVHHVSYDRLWAELPTDLQTLCETCHNMIHRGKSMRIPAVRRARRREAELRRDRPAVRLAIDRHPRSTADIAVLAGTTPHRAGRALRDLHRQGLVRYLDRSGTWLELSR